LGTKRGVSASKTTQLLRLVETVRVWAPWVKIGLDEGFGNSLDSREHDPFKVKTRLKNKGMAGAVGKRASWRMENFKGHGEKKEKDSFKNVGKKGKKKWEGKKLGVGEKGDGGCVYEGKEKTAGTGNRKEICKRWTRREKLGRKRANLRKNDGFWVKN